MSHGTRLEDQENFVSEFIENLSQEDEEKLQEIHAKNYSGTDDDMPDRFEHWLMNRTYADLVKYGLIEN